MGATVTSFYFLCFLLTVIIVYYIVPQKLQWCVLLLASIAYYLLSGNGILILYPVLTCLTAWLCTRQIGKAQEQSVKRIWMIAAVCLLIVLSALTPWKWLMIPWMFLIWPSCFLGSYLRGKRRRFVRAPEDLRELRWHRIRLTAAQGMNLKKQLLANV